MSILDKLLGGTARSRHVDALIQRLHENVEEDGERFPADAGQWAAFVRFLEETLRGYANVPAEQGEKPEPVDAAVRFFATGDRMHAYACILPPLDGGEEIRPDVFGREMLKSGICAGIDQEAVMECMTKKEYLHIFPVARGTPVRHGEDGREEPLFKARPVFVIEARQGKTADFREARPVQLIRKGETVCNVVAATPGTDGVDVLGKVLPARPGKPLEINPRFNLALSEDGKRLVAMENGAVFQREGGLYVQTAVIRQGPLKPEDKLVWIAYIDGDVPEGVKLDCTNGILVMGEIRGEITAKGSVRAQRGIRKGAKVEARGQVLAPVIENSTVSAGKEIIAEAIRYSKVASNASIYVLGGQGLIEGGSVEARGNVECLQVGGPSGARGRVVLGHAQDIGQELARVGAELGEAQETLEKLMKHIMKLRMAGSALTMDDRELLGQLMEQKALYEQKVSDLSTELQQVKDARVDLLDSELICPRMEPPLTVQIGDRTGEFRYPETNCRFHLYAGQVVSR